MLQPWLPGVAARPGNSLRGPHRSGSNSGGSAMQRPQRHADDAANVHRSCTAKDWCEI